MWDKFSFIFTIYFHGSVHRDSILIRPNKMQQYAGIYLLQNHSTCFECPSHPSSGVHKTVTAASGTGHSIWATTFFQRGLRPHWRKVVAQILWPVPEAAVTVLCSSDDGSDGRPKHVESDFALNNHLHTVACFGSCYYRVMMHGTMNIKFKIWFVRQSNFTDYCHCTTLFD